MSRSPERQRLSQSERPSRSSARMQDLRDSSGRSDRSRRAPPKYEPFDRNANDPRLDMLLITQRTEQPAPRRRRSSSRRSDPAPDYIDFDLRERLRRDQERRERQQRRDEENRERRSRPPSVSSRTSIARAPSVSSRNSRGRDEPESSRLSDGARSPRRGAADGMLFGDPKGKGKAREPTVDEEDESGGLQLFPGALPASSSTAMPPRTRSAELVRTPEPARSPLPLSASLPPPLKSAMRRGPSKHTSSESSAQQSPELPISRSPELVVSPPPELSEPTVKMPALAVAGDEPDTTIVQSSTPADSSSVAGDSALRSSKRGFGARLRSFGSSRSSAKSPVSPSSPMLEHMFARPPPMQSNALSDPFHRAKSTPVQAPELAAALAASTDATVPPILVPTKPSGPRAPGRPKSERRRSGLRTLFKRSKSSEPKAPLQASALRVPACALLLPMALTHAVACPSVTEARDPPSVSEGVETDNEHFTDAHSDFEDAESDAEEPLVNATPSTAAVPVTETQNQRAPGFVTAAGNLLGRWTTPTQSTTNLVAGGTPRQTVPTIPRLADGTTETDTEAEHESTDDRTTEEGHEIASSTAPSTSVATPPLDRAIDHNLLVIPQELSTSMARSSSGLSRTSQRPPSYRSTAHTVRDEKTVETVASDDQEEGPSRRPMLGFGRRSNSTETTTSRPKIEKRPSRLSMAFNDAGSMLNDAYARASPAIESAVSTAGFRLNEAAAGVLTGAMSLTDKLAGVEKTALPANEALSKPKPRRVSFATHEVTDTQSKKRIGPLIAGRVLVSDQDIVRLRDENPDFRRTSPASPTGAMPREYRSAIKRYGPTASSSTPNLLKHDPPPDIDAPHSQPEVARSSSAGDLLK